MKRWKRNNDGEQEPLLDRSALAEVGEVSTSGLGKLGFADGAVQLDSQGLEGVPFVHLDEWDQFETAKMVERLAAIAVERSVSLHYASLEPDGLAASAVYEVPQYAVSKLAEYMTADRMLARTSALFLADLSLVFVDTDEDVGFVAGLPEIIERFGSTSRTRAEYAARFPTFRDFRSELLATFDPSPEES